MSIKTHDEVRASFNRTGISVAGWARSHGLNVNLVRQILAGRRACLRGESHRAAVLLGLKDGVIVSGPNDLDATAHGRKQRRAT